MIEVEALIPIVGFLKKDVGEIKSCSLVLAGDYQQLEPVVVSPAAKALGYSKYNNTNDFFKKNSNYEDLNPLIHIFLQACPYWNA